MSRALIYFFALLSLIFLFFFLIMVISNYILFISSLVVSNLLLIIFSQILFKTELSNLTIGLAYNFFFIYIDNFTFIFVLLVLLIFPLLLCYNFFKTTFNFKFVTFLIMMLQFLLLFIFLINNFFIFYMFFELIIIPMVLLIGLYGSRGRKLHALYLFFYYTFISSMFIFLSFLFFIFYDFGFIFFEFSFLSSQSVNLFFYLVLVIGFLAKIPTFPVYIWLPEAHVEAPTVGSVLLAGVLLKLGYFGIFKTFWYLIDTVQFNYFIPIFSTIFLISFFYSSFSAICQIDLKKIVAYSSIVHMNFAMLGILNIDFGVFGSLFLMFSHGLISTAMFFCVGFLYDRFFTRNILYYGGLVQFMPIFSVLYFLIISSNMSLPLTCNFIGEFLILCSIFNNSFTLLFISSIGLIFTSIFCLILLIRVIFYQITSQLNLNMIDLYLFECIILLILVFLIVLFGIFPNLIFNLIIII